MTTAAELVELIDAKKALGFKLSPLARQVEKAARVEVRTGTAMPMSCAREANRLSDDLEKLPERPRSLLKSSSHRSRDSVVRLIGRKPQFFYSWCREYQVMELTADELKLVLDAGIKGVAPVVDGDGWYQCWNTSSR